jgi:hypothetical protein
MQQHFSNLAIRDSSLSSQPSQVPVLAQNQDVDMADQSHQVEPQSGQRGPEPSSTQPQDEQRQDEAAHSGMGVDRHTSQPHPPVKYVYLARRCTRNEYDKREGEYYITYGAYVSEKDAENRLRKETHSDELSDPFSQGFYATWTETRRADGRLELQDDEVQPAGTTTLWVERLEVLASGPEEEWVAFDPVKHVKGYNSEDDSESMSDEEEDV